MKLFHKLRSSDKTPVDGHATVQSAIQPALSLAVTLHDNQKNALIGWLAGRMGEKLGADARNQNDAARQKSVSPVVPNSDHESGSQYLFELAARLVEWTARRDDIYKCMKETSLHEPYYSCLLELYDEVREDLNLYVPASVRGGDSCAEKDRIWEVYRDVIYAATQGKFLLIDKQEVDSYKQGRLLCSSQVAERADIPASRNLAKEKLLAIGLPQPIVMSHLLVISEAVTNILKHATEGRMTLVEGESAIHVLVEDKGPGFPLKLLPNATLMAGYSTKKSLGQGFTLMMKMSERLLLSTVAGEGSALILVLNRKEGEQRADKFTHG